MSYTNLPHNLTGQVIKTENHYFAFGESGDIYRGRWAKNNSDIVEVAVKVPRVTVTNTEELAMCTQRHLRIAKIWSMLSHPNITPFFGISFNFHRPPTPCLVLQHFRHGNILTHLKEHPNVNKMHLIAQVARAIYYLHSLAPTVIHGDIKASNILINNNLEASLGDFGQCRIQEGSAYEPTITREEEFNARLGVAESWRWKAYELVAPCEKEDFIPRTTTATDVWAFAMAVLEILTNCLPYSHIKMDANVILAIASGGHPQRDRYPPIDDEIWAVLQKCWNIDPEQRPSMANLAYFFGSKAAL